jgi:multicomponent Na+:H+ antiporter subunit F
VTAIVLVLSALVTIGLASARLMAGPTQADRVVAVELVVSALLAAIAAAALVTGRPLVLDVGIGMAMVGFVGTLAWCRLIDARARGGQ